MNEKEIKQIYNQKKKEIKKSYKISLEALHEDYEATLAQALDERRIATEEYYAAIDKKPPENPPKRAIIEEIGNAVTHGLGAIFGIVALVLMLIASENTGERVAAIIYSLGLTVMFSMSCLYHAFSHGSAVKRLFRRFDYSGIYLLIGATFAPVLICVFGDLFGWMFFAIQWAIIAAGISLVGVFGPTRLRFIHIPMYLLLGWSALMLLPGMYAASAALMWWILGGGVVYTLGIIPFAMKAKVSHFIWHFFVLAGAIVQWVGIYLHIYLV